MKLTNATIINALDALDGSSQINKATDLPVKAKWALAINTKALREVFAVYEEERVELAKQYAKDIDAEGHVTAWTDGTGNAYLADVNDLRAQEAEVTITTIAIDDLNSTAISANDLIAIAFMVEQ